MRALVRLERLLSGKDAVADVAADAAGGVLALVDQLSDRVCSRASAPNAVLK